jgi:hypothetical protein
MVKASVPRSVAFSSQCTHFIELWQLVLAVPMHDLSPEVGMRLQDAFHPVCE